MRLGYERTVNDKRIQISVEESDDPIVTIKIHGREDIRFKASDDTDFIVHEKLKEIKEIVEAVHQAYINTNQFNFA